MYPAVDEKKRKISNTGDGKDYIIVIGFVVVVLTLIVLNGVGCQ